MTSNSYLTAATVTPSSYVVGDSATYTFTVTSPTSLNSGDYLYL